MYTDFRPDAAHRHTLVTHGAWLEEARAAEVVSPLLDIPGFDIWAVRFDIMHCLDLGVYQVIVSSALAELARTGVGVFRGFTLQSRLEHATRLYRAWCKGHGVATVAKRLTVGWLGGRITQQHAKAAAMRGLLGWLRDVCATVQQDEHSRLRARLLAELVDGDEILRQHAAGRGRFLPEDARASVGRHFERAFVCQNALAAHCRTAGLRLLYRLLPKNHAAMHLALDSGNVNPRTVSCYQDEDMVGRMKRVYQRCHGTTAPERALLRYTIMAALRWHASLLELRMLAAAGTRELAAAGLAASTAASSGLATAGKAVPSNPWVAASSGSGGLAAAGPEAAATATPTASQQRLATAGPAPSSAPAASEERATAGPAASGASSEPTASRGLVRRGPAAARPPKRHRACGM